MGKQLSFIILSAFVLIFFVGCSKKTATPSNKTNVQQYSFYATINGTLWGTDSVSAIKYTDSQSGMVTILILAENTDGSSIVVGVPENTTPGSYDINKTSLYGVSYKGPLGAYLASSGKIVITSNKNNIVAGTFDCTMAPDPSGNSKGTLTITNGGFNTAY